MSFKVKAVNKEKLEKLEREVAQKTERIKRMKQVERTAKRKEETRRKVVLGGVVDMIDKINNGQYPALALDVPLLVGLLTNDLLMKRVNAQADFLRGEGEKRINERAKK
ncbi:TPA: hypothetical protein RRD46_005489 [Klebsiella pneumoniae]|nr:hypothetical protein [Klebsiella pneumoniae]